MTLTKQSKMFSGLELFRIWHWKEQMMLKQQGPIRLRKHKTLQICTNQHEEI